MCRVILFVPTTSSIKISVPILDLDILFHVPSLLPGKLGVSGKTNSGNHVGWGSGCACD